jgi:hypothetical protein
MSSKDETIIRTAEKFLKLSEKDKNFVLGYMEGVLAHARREEKKAKKTA